jgi:hypothetical protein
MKHWYTWISKHYKYNWWNIDIHEYQNTTSITDETLIYMNIKHYKYNWCNIDIHEYQILQVLLVKHWYTWTSNTTSITGETLRYMNIKTLQV